MDCSLPGSSVHGILQARLLEWVAISFSRGDLPDPGIEPGSPALKADSLLIELQGKPFPFLLPLLQSKLPASPAWMTIKSSSLSSCLLSLNPLVHSVHSMFLIFLKLKLIRLLLCLKAQLFLTTLRIKFKSPRGLMKHLLPILTCLCHSSSLAWPYPLPSAYQLGVIH